MQISCGYVSTGLLKDHILRQFRTPPDISYFDIFSSIYQVGSVNECKWMRITYYFLQVRRVETRCAYLFNAQMVLERTSPSEMGHPLRIADISHVLPVVSLLYTTAVHSPGLLHLIHQKVSVPV